MPNSRQSAGSSRPHRLAASSDAPVPSRRNQHGHPLVAKAKRADEATEIEVDSRTAHDDSTGPNTSTEMQVNEDNPAANNKEWSEDRPLEAAGVP